MVRRNCVETADGRSHCEVSRCPALPELRDEAQRSRERLRVLRLVNEMLLSMRRRMSPAQSADAAVARGTAAACNALIEPLLTATGRGPDLLSVQGNELESGEPDIAVA